MASLAPEAAALFLLFRFFLDLLFCFGMGGAGGASYRSLQLSGQADRMKTCDGAQGRLGDAKCVHTHARLCREGASEWEAAWRTLASFL